MNALVRNLKLTSLNLGFIAFLSISYSMNSLAKGKTKGFSMESAITPSSIKIDGEIDKQWDLAEPLHLVLNELPYKPNNGYKGLKETDLEIRSLYDDVYIYFFYRWYDPTISLERFPWEKKSDGSWEQLSNKDSTLHENTYYEDKLAVYWNINERGFIKKGCDKSCHMVEEGLLEGIKDTSSGRHYTINDGETTDEWHWKGMRTNPNGQMEDGYVNNEHETNKKWGRQTDEHSGGGYYNNTNDTDFPAWMNGIINVKAPFWVFDDTKVPFKDTFKPGDKIGGIVTTSLEGSRGDVTALGVWRDNHWYLEIKRKRVTNYPMSASQDVQFDDLSKAYYFGVTAFDNSQINHLYHKKSVKLTFKQ